MDGDGDHFLSVLPSKWVVKNGWKNDASTSKNYQEGMDLCYWPRGLSGYRLLEKTKKDPSVPIDKTQLSTHRCKLKRSNFKTFSEAFREQKSMEIQSDTEEYEPRKKLRTDNSAAELFKAIQASKPGLKPTAPLLPPVPSAPVAADAVPESSQFNRESTQQLSESTPPFDAMQSYTDEISHVRKELELVRYEMANLSEGQNATQVQVNRCISLLSQLNAKVDVLAVQKPSPVESNNLVQLRKITLTPVRCLNDLEGLEQNSRNAAFIESIVESLGPVHDKDRYFGDGWTVCLQIVDYFFEKEFLMGCSWTGTSRNKKNEDVIISKIAFHKYVKVIDLFYQVVIYSDPSFTPTDCQRFLHRCLKNAKQLFEEIKGTRTSVSRKRCKQIRSKPVLKMEIQDNVEINPDEAAADFNFAEGEEEYDAASQGAIIVEEYLVQDLQ